MRKKKQVKMLCFVFEAQNRFREWRHWLWVRFRKPRQLTTEENFGSQIPRNSSAVNCRWFSHFLGS